jgi:uncharacterized protein (DUF1800 family)
MNDFASLWTRYEPDDKAPWDLSRAVHLQRRAGFAATWDELQRDLKDGPVASVERLLKGTATLHSPAEFASMADLLAGAAVAAGDIGRLKAWWMYRLLFSPDPLGEKLTLLWHNHFATSHTKVQDTGAMRRQNDTFRKQARAPFGKLLNGAVRDPALLIFLDAPANRKGHANENLARELMELFTLGLGHFTEKDVKAAARTLTGWTVEKGVFKDDMNLHDPGEKTLLGKTGPWKGDDMVRMLLEHPATAERLAFRICEIFLGDGAVDPTIVKSLATGLRERNLDVGWAVETVLRSETFFAEANLGNRILSPPEYVVGVVRALELFDHAPSTLILAEFIANLGQNLFYPANVFGWPGGRSWISSRSAVGRYNYAVALVGGADVGRAPAFDPWVLARRHGQGKDLASVVAFHAELILGRVPDVSWRNRILDTLGAEAIATAATARQAVALVLASPEAQLA